MLSKSENLSEQCYYLSFSSLTKKKIQHIYKWQDPVMATSVGTAQSKGQRLIQQKTINGVL